MPSGGEGRLRLAVTGASGRLGAALCRRYTQRHDVIAISRSDLDLADPAAVEAALAPLDFEVLINTAAFTMVDECERKRELAYDINAHAAGAMAVACREKGARMVQVSTDFVFDGTKTEPYGEGDATNPINVYGQSKLLGEAQVLARCADALVARVSWVFGSDKPGFPEWLIGQARTRRRFAVPGDKIACPTYSEDFAALLEPLFAGPLPEGNILHLCNGPPVSWFQYAAAIIELLRESGERLVVEELTEVNSGEIQQFVASRPLRTALATGAYESHTGGSIPSWPDAIRRHLADIAGR